MNSKKLDNLIKNNKKSHNFCILCDFFIKNY